MTTRFQKIANNLFLDTQRDRRFCIQHTEPPEEVLAALADAVAELNPLLVDPVMISFVKLSLPERKEVTQ